jgi:cellulose synthase/poly-beta-1,6-N-acetylglucosamine synthase-like glycosyltransferase
MPLLAQYLGLSLIAAILVVGYAYTIYPILISLLSRLFGRTQVRPAVATDELPSITLIISAYNEKNFIQRKLDSVLTMKYPRNRLEIIVASDGSTDDTNDIVLEYASRGVKLKAFAERRGKSAVLNDVIPHAHGEIVILSDANTFHEPDAATKLVAWFTNPDVGIVCGRLVLFDPVNGRNVDSLYWKYETFIKKCEAKLGALLGSNGGIYAIRKSVYQPIPNDTIIDDFVIPLLAKQATSCEIVYDAEAVAVEETPPWIGQEFNRRSRIGAGGFQAMPWLAGLLHPRHGWLAFAFFNHKVLRWMCPFLLVFALLGNVAWVVLCMPHLGSQRWLPWASLLLALQVGFYSCSILAGMLPARPKFLRIFRLPAMFTTMNAALAVGFYRYVRGRQRAAWERSERAELTSVDMPRPVLADHPDHPGLPAELKLGLAQPNLDLADDFDDELSDSGISSSGSKP